MIDVYAVENDIWVIAPHGRIDVPAARALEDALADLLETGRVRLVIDFSYAVYITSAGLKTLLSAMRRCRRMGGDMHLACMNDRVLEIFEMAGFDQVFGIHPVVADATQAFAGA